MKPTITISTFRAREAFLQQSTRQARGSSGPRGLLRISWGLGGSRACWVAMGSTQLTSPAFASGW